MEKLKKSKKIVEKAEEIVIPPPFAFEKNIHQNLKQISK